MSTQIIIEKNVTATKMAIVYKGELIGYHIESFISPDWQNKIVVGQVMQVVKNLNAVFVDYGNGKNGLLHLKQVPDFYLKKIQVGYRLPVQITKQNIGDKGHKLTANLNLTGKYLVCLPFEKGINISKKISHTPTRSKLKKVLGALEQSYGFIVRTHAKEASVEALIQDAEELIREADKILASSQYLTKGTILYEEAPLLKRMIRKYYSKDDTLELICNNAEFIERYEQSIQEEFSEEALSVKLLPNEKAIFSVYGIQKKIDELVKRKIWLKSGGNLVLDYTEAMTIIDVNSAKAILGKNADKAILELNRQAVKEAILQILRRNLSGIIIVDLVEMKSEVSHQMVYEYAKELLQDYKDTRTRVYPLTELGLLQFSRTKKYQCIPHQLLAPCSNCHLPYTEFSFLYEMLEVENKLKNVELKNTRQVVYLEISPEFMEILKESDIIQQLEKKYSLEIVIKKEAHTRKNKILCQFYQ